MLPIMDNLEKAASSETTDKSYQEGVNMVVKQYATALEKFGLKEIETIGKRFDPELHEAVSHIEDESKGEQEIVEEYRKGYQIGNKVIRHALVVVAN
jgi:molecular chaperone GrpE